LNANAADACRTNCQLPRCGDRIQDSVEVCDDGNTTSGDNCSSDCRSLEVCGNSIIDTIKGEQCDNGAANSAIPNAACRPDCTTRRCGDAIVDGVFGELCDLGGTNSNAANATCRTNCAPQRCGDGVLDDLKGEVCDDGNIVSGDGCSAAGEQCDDGNTVDGDGCQGNCAQPRCGDRIKDVGLDEECDAGEANSHRPRCAMPAQLPAAALR
jgi:cysteine-rich repeat protein